jgi:hypothetical protein
MPEYPITYAEYRHPFPDAAWPAVLVVGTLQVADGPVRAFATPVPVLPQATCPACRDRAVATWREGWLEHALGEGS